MNIPLGIYQTISLLNALLSLSIGIFVLFTKRISRQTILFSAFAFLVFFWSFFYFLAFQTSNYSFSAFLFRTCMIAGALILPVFTEFVYTLVGKEIKSIYRWINFGVAALIISTIYTNLYASDGGPFLVYHYWPLIGTMSSIQIIHYAANIFFSLGELFRASFWGVYRLRQQAKIVLFGTFLGYLGAATNFLLWFRIPFPPVLNLLIPIYVMSVAYAITKHRLMDISVIISRALAEILTVLYLGTIYLSLVWLYRIYISVRIDLPFIIWTVIFGIIVGQTFQRTRLFVQTSSDKLFLRGKYDYYKELSDASARVGEKLSMGSILGILYETFYKVVEISKPRIFLPEYFTDPQKTAEHYVVYDKETHLPESSGEQINFNDPLVGQLILTRDPILDPHKPERELVVPCLLEERLIAIFVLGRKLSEDPYTDEDVRLLEVLASQAAMALDHTRSYEKIRADLETTEKQLARSERLASLGTLTAGVTHEIRNPLTVIRSETERLATQARDMVYLEQHRGLVLKHVDRIAGIVQRMLGLAKEKPAQKVDIDLNELINSTLELFTISRISLKKDLQEVPRIKGEPEELHQVFVNLIQNAMEAMPEGGRLTLRTYVEDGRVAAEVSDTGKGIPEEIREKIFDPFFSTRHEGVGLGLSITYRIIREHGGDINVRCEEGKGTTFKILF